MMATEKRLISLDEALEATHKEVFWTESEQAAVRSFLVKQPKVDAVEVVHGRWVIEKRKTLSRNPYMDDNYHAHATCSECGFCIHSENASFGYPELNTTNYCPNCGAKMDGDGID